jgi:hypothetical protein
MTGSYQPYRHTQVGTLMLWVLVPVTVLAGLYALGTRFNLTSVGALALLGFCLITFWSLTVVVDRERVQIRFGPGLFSISYAVREIQNCRVVTNSPMAGWGIRLINMGWLFNVSGLEAVEIELKNGRRVRIGSDQPEALARAIENAMITTHKH